MVCSGHTSAAFEALRDQSLSLQARGEVLWMRDANSRIKIHDACITCKQLLTTCWSVLRELREELLLRLRLVLSLPDTPPTLASTHSSFGLNCLSPHNRLLCTLALQTDTRIEAGRRPRPHSRSRRRLASTRTTPTLMNMWRS
jgi:hypothetical protein